MFKKGNVLELENDKKYVVVDKFDENNNTYVYLVNIDNNADMIFARLEGDEIVTLSDPLELEKVVNKVHDNLRENKK